MSTPPKTCSICKRADVEAVDLALMNGASTRGIEASFEGTSRSSASYHRKHCLKLTPVYSDGSKDTPTSVDQVSTETTGKPDGQGGDGSKDTVPVAAFRNATYRRAFLAVTEPDQIAHLADLIETNHFHFHHTLTWLEQAWKLSPLEVRHRYEQAVRRCSADRQMALAQLEVTLAAFETQEREAMAEFRRLRRKAPGQARGYLNAAIRARMEYADLAGLKTIRIEANVNVWTHPAFVVAVDRFTEAALDVIAPLDAEATAFLGRVEARLGRPVDVELAAALLSQLQEEAAVRFDALRAEEQGEPLATAPDQGGETSASGAP